MADLPTQVIYGVGDKTVRECVQALLGEPNIEILPLAARATVVALTVEGNVVQLGHAGFGQLELVLVVTNADKDAGDTLDVLVDCSIDGVSWVNICHFTQIIGTDAASTIMAVIPRTGTGAVVNATADLTAGNVRNFIGTWLRSRTTRVDANSDEDMTFTYSLNACLKP
jgi:hypothetical protein